VAAVVALDVIVTIVVLATYQERGKTRRERRRVER
jgi:hypothetical protein